MWQVPRNWQFDILKRQLKKWQIQEVIIRRTRCQSKTCGTVTIFTQHTCFISVLDKKKQYEGIAIASVLNLHICALIVVKEKVTTPV